MPYACKLDGSKWKLTKVGSNDALGTHDSKKSCIQQMRAIYSKELKNPQNLVFDGPIFDNGLTDYRISQSKDEIHVVINSQGGDFFDSITMHNKLRASGKQVICHIDPFAFSAGANLALAGDKIYMVENGMMMFHPPALQSSEAKNADELEKNAEALRKGEEILVNTLMSKTKMSKEKCEAIIKNETWLTAEEAMNMGIVDEIIPIYRDVKVENYFPDKIVNFLKEKRDMPLKEICQKFGIQGDSEEALTGFIEGLVKNQPKPPSEIAPTILNMMKESRVVLLDSLVATGKAIPAVTNDLKLKFLTDERIKLDAQTGNTEFENIINSHQKNEEVMSFKGKSGTQKLKDDNKGNEDEDDTLINDMKKRAAEMQA